MPVVKYVVDLSDPERDHLLQRLACGKPSARSVLRARILLLADEGRTDEAIAAALHTSSATVGRVRQRFVEEGLEQALKDRPRPGQQRKLSGHQEAYLIATTCSPAPTGHKRWTLRLLADQVVELGFAESCSHETVRQLLKKTISSRGNGASGAFPK